MWTLWWLRLKFSVLSGVDFEHFILKLVLNWVSQDSLVVLGGYFLSDRDSRDMSSCARRAFAEWCIKPLDAESCCAASFFQGRLPGILTMLQYSLVAFYCWWSEAIFIFESTVIGIADVWCQYLLKRQQVVWLTLHLLLVWQSVSKAVHWLKGHSRSNEGTMLLNKIFLVKTSLM